MMLLYLMRDKSIYLYSNIYPVSSENNFWTFMSTFGYVRPCSPVEKSVNPTRYRILIRNQKRKSKPEFLYLIKLEQIELNCHLFSVTEWLIVFNRWRTSGHLWQKQPKHRKKHWYNGYCEMDKYYEKFLISHYDFH